VACVVMVEVNCDDAFGVTLFKNLVAINDAYKLNTCKLGNVDRKS
jgi:hypothetical protein